MVILVVYLSLLVTAHLWKLINISRALQISDQLIVVCSSTRQWAKNSLSRFLLCIFIVIVKKMHYNCLTDLGRRMKRKSIHLPQIGHYTINYCYLVVTLNEQNKQTRHYPTFNCYCLHRIRWSQKFSGWYWLFRWKFDTENVYVWEVRILFMINRVANSWAQPSVSICGPRIHFWVRLQYTFGRFDFSKYLNTVTCVWICN